MTTPMSDREALARMFNPTAFSPMAIERGIDEGSRQAALAKADQWLARSSGGGEKGWLPIVLCPTDGEWRAVLLPDGSEAVAAFDGHSLRAGYWQVKEFAYRNPAKVIGQRGGVNQYSAAYDTHVITRLPEGIYPTHFRPNDTVYGQAGVVHEAQQ